MKQRGEDSGGAQRPPSMSPEEHEQVMKFLSELEVMEKQDPQQFAQVMAQLGLPSEGASAGGPAGMGNAKSVVEAISQMRASAAQGMNAPSGQKDIKLPDGKTMSSSGGVQAKQKGIEITPEAGFVVKTRRIADGLKVFINICKHNALGEPAIKKKLDAEGKEVEGMNIPLSVGPRRFDKDKSDAQCHVYDVIVNPTVIDDVIADITGKKRDFLCQLALQGLEQKYKEQLDKRYKLPKLKYLGANIASQLIQDRKSQPVIEEINVPSSANKKKASRPVVPAVVKREEDLLYEVSWVAESASESTPDRVVISSLQRDEHGSIPLYTEPLSEAPPGMTHIVFTANVDMSISGTNLSDIDVKVSAYKLVVAVKGYKSVSLSLPAAVLPPSSVKTTQSPSRTYSILRPVEGYTRLVELKVGMALDLADWSDGPDPGSKPWLIAEALGGDGKREMREKAAVEEDDKDSNRLPEDKFHINLPDGVDKYTGLPLDRDDDVLPEDRFHKADASSNYIIEQRENDIRKKWEKHEKEKAERANDPNVEYVELDDYKAGGKYGPEKDPTSAAFDQTSSIHKEDLQKASEVVASSVKMNAFDWSQEPDMNDIDIDVDDDEVDKSATDSRLECKPGLQPAFGGLSSTLWTELLD